MITNIHRARDGRKIIAVCDKELLGKKFKEKDRQLDLSSKFYKGKELDDDNLKKLLKTAYIINAAGEKTTNFLIKNKIIQKENIIYIENIPHAQCLLIE